MNGSDSARDPNATAPQIPVLVEKKRDGSVQNATRWLRKVDFELSRQYVDRKIPPGEFLSTVDTHVDGDAADWADSNPIIRRMLSAESVMKAKDSDVATFISVFLGRYSSRQVDESGTALPRMQALRQSPSETLMELYHRTLDLLLNCGGKDREDGQELEPAQTTLLMIAINAYCSALHRADLRIKALDYTLQVGRSLHGAFEFVSLQEERLASEKEMIARMISDKRLELMEELLPNLTMRDGRHDTIRIPQGKVDTLQ